MHTTYPQQKQIISIPNFTKEYMRANQILDKIDATPKDELYIGYKDKDAVPPIPEDEKFIHKTKPVAPSYQSFFGM